MSNTDFALRGKEKWILVVDDDEALRELIARTLGRHGHTVHGVGSGREAVQRIAETPVCLMILDYRLPDMTGQALVKTLPERGLDMPFIVMTGQGDERLAVELMKLGAADYLIKDTELMDRLPSVVERALQAIEMKSRLREAEDALQSRERRFFQLIQNSFDAIVILDADGIQRYVSASAERVHGYSSAELTDIPVIEQMIHPDDQERVLAAFRQVLETGEGEAQYRHRRKGGGWVHLEARGTNQLDNPDIRGVVINVRDITGRKQAEKALQESEHMFRSITNNAADAIFIKDINRRYTFVNPAAQRLIGLPLERIIGSTPEEVYGHEQGLMIKKLDDRSFAGEYVNETKCLEIGNDKYYLSTSQGPLTVENGVVTVIMGIVRNMTAQMLAEEALRESQATFQKLFDQSADAILLIDKNRVFVECNQAALNLLKMTRDDFMHRSPASISPEFQPDGRRSDEAAQDMMDQAYSKGLHRFDWTCINSEGGEFILEVSLMPIVIKGQTMLHTTWRDITERKQAEEALRESEAQKAAILGGITTNIALVDRDLRILWANKAAASVRKQPSDLVGHPCFSFWGDSVKPCANCPTAKAFQTKQSEHIIVYTPDGRIWDEGGEPILEPDGTVRYVVEIAQDITERMQAEQKLAESEDRFSRAIAGTGAGLWDWDMVNDRIFFSPQWKTMLGYQGHEIENNFSGWKNLWHPDDAARIEKAVNDYLEGRTTVYEIEHRQRHKDDGWHWILTRGDIQKNAEGKPVRWTGTNIDITGRKRAEEEKELLQSQLAQAQKMESIGRLAGGVAHDFNNMLGVILGNVELLLEGHASGQAGHTELEEIRKAANRSADLTRQLLAFARKQTVTPRVIDLNATVEGMLKMLRRLIGENIHLAWAPASHLDPVLMDSSQLDQILANLCINARDAIGETGKITIETARAYFNEAYCKEHAGFMPGEYVMLSVNDSGRGMDAETLSHLFEPFFTTKELGKGTGLGLATVYGAVRQNNGFIHVMSEPGQGSTFRIYLPRHADNVASCTEKEHARATGGGTILLVEDEPGILTVTTTMLK